MISVTKFMVNEEWFWPWQETLEKRKWKRNISIGAVVIVITANVRLIKNYVFYQVSRLELLQKVKSIRCSTLQRQILVYCCLQPVQTLQLVVFHGAQSPSEIKRSHMQCSASWQSYLHIAAKELLVLLVVVPNGKALCQDSCKLTLSSFIFIVAKKCKLVN